MVRHAVHHVVATCSEVVAAIYVDDVEVSSEANLPEILARPGAVLVL